MQQTDEQRELLASLRELVERVLGDRHESLCGAGFSSETWQTLGGELGLLAASLPEAMGGMAAGQEADAILMEAFGKHLVSQPYLSSVVMAAALLDVSDDAGSQHLAAAAQGEAILVPALADSPSDTQFACVETVATITDNEVLLQGSKVLVRDAPLADRFIVLARQDGAADCPHVLLILDADVPGISREDFGTIDAATGSHLRFDQVRLDRSAIVVRGSEALERAALATDSAIVAVCAEAIGVMQAMLEQTVEYAKQRVQFGQPIAGFQVLQHRMVDMSVAIEQAESITRLARGKLLTPDRAKAASAAMALVAKACRGVAQDAVQIHGAVGIADETPISRYFRRALAIEKQFGGKAYHLKRYMQSADTF